jgi:hypothetical protein
MRGENPNTFPLRLTPPESAGTDFMETYPTISISRKEDTVTLTETDKKIMEQLPLIVQNIDDTHVGTKMTELLTKHHTPPEEGGAVEISDFILDQTMQVGNITYPNGSYGTKGWEIHMKDEITSVRGHKIKQYSWINKDITLESVFGAEGLRNYAPKIAAIVNSIRRADGIQFVYSRYVKAGALPICIALELNGWCRVLADGTPAPILKRKDAPPAKHYYVLLTSDDTLSPNFKGLVNYATSFESPDDAQTGKKVKAILGSQIASEGLDLKCIREVHLLDGWYHLNRIEQIEGRGVRFCSHVLLPKQLRNTLIYLHVVSVSEYETADLYAYRLAVRKAQPIGRVTRLMKINAWDCMLNKDAILLADMHTRTIKDAQGRTEKDYDVKDKSYTGFCDFLEDCTYTCGSKAVPKKNIGKNQSTYTESDFRRLFLSKHEELQRLFANETAMKLEDVQKLVYDGIPSSIGTIGIREALGSLKIKRKDGIYGTLILLNGYIVFQPEGVTDTQIPLAYRYGRAYGRLPREFVPQRKHIMETEIEVPEMKEEERKVASDIGMDALRESAYISLRNWHAVLRRMISEPNGKIEPLTKFSKENFNGWRWLFHHFRSLKETESIACRWWMDNMWTWQERNAVLNHWTILGLNTLKGDDALYARLFQPRELFQGELSGYVIYNMDSLSLQTYCFLPGKDKVPSLCTSVLKPDVDAAIGEPIDRKSDQTGIIYGFLVSKRGTVIVKTVDKENGNHDGAQCANTSNLANHASRIKIIHDEIRKHKGSPILSLLLGDDLEKASSEELRTERQAALKRRFDGVARAEIALPDIQHTMDLTLKQICPYMEYLLRWMEMNSIGKKHWFLSVAESARAGIKFT